MLGPSPSAADLVLMSEGMKILRVGMGQGDGQRISERKFGAESVGAARFKRVPVAFDPGGDSPYGGGGSRRNVERSGLAGGRSAPDEF